MYQLDINNEQYRCYKRDDKAVAGNKLNSALFFTQRFYEKLPIPSLIPLAAHTVLSASRINSTGIGGLEIIRCSRGKFKPLSDRKIAELVEWSENLDHKIKRLVRGLG